jgi:hypothetical protein
MMHDKIEALAMPWAFEIQPPSAEWCKQVEAEAIRRCAELERSIWTQAVIEYRAQELSTLTARHYVSRLTAMLDGAE